MTVYLSADWLQGPPGRDATQITNCHGYRGHGEERETSDPRVFALKNFSCLPKRGSDEWPAINEQTRRSQAARPSFLMINRTRGQASAVEMTVMNIPNPSASLYVNNRDLSHLKKYEKKITSM